MIRCSPEAFAVCPTRALCGRVQDATFTEGSECDKFNQSVMSRPMSALEKIRALNDERMVDFLYRLIQIGDISGLYCLGKKECFELVDLGQPVPVRLCRGCFLEWLSNNTEEVFDV